MTFFDLCGPYVTFDPKLVMSQVRIHTLVIVTRAAWSKSDVACLRYCLFDGKKQQKKQKLVYKILRLRRQDNEEWSKMSL